MKDTAIVKFIVPDTDKEIAFNFTYLEDTNALDYSINISDAFKNLDSNEPCLAFYLSQVFVNALTSNSAAPESDTEVEPEETE